MIVTTTATPTADASPNPHSFYSRLDQIGELMDQEEWAKARNQIKEINATGLYAPGGDNPYLMLAQACNKLDDLAGEKEALTTVAAHEGDSWAAVSRLLEIADTEKDYAGMARWGEASLAIHPMGVTAWRALLDAHEQRKENAAGIEAALALLQLDPPDLASIHYRVAKMLQPTDPTAARRQVLQALEEAPRFRAAYELLATLPPSPTASTSTPAAPLTPATP
jgi:tetratricopeptide (TPR) repeat protein